jgi:3-deoxy-7-phosphoheptulonate synthase
MIVILNEGAKLEDIHLVERALRRGGVEPRRLQGSGLVALDAPGADPGCVDGLASVRAVLSAVDAHPLASRGTRADRTVVDLGGGVRIGAGAPVLMAGPCAVESRVQVISIAAAVAAAGGKVLRGGAFKPRTSPYAFQGLGEEGLRLLREAADRHGLRVVTEVMEPGAVSLVSEYADLLQVGSRNMQNFPLLRAVGRARRPVLLKRGMSATVEEWLLAAEYVLDGGNPNVVLCERGLRSFDPAVRNTLDLAVVPILKEETHLPVCVDPSHGVGVRSAIPAMCKAALAAGADALLVEVHPDPGCARSDGHQALGLADLAGLGPLFAPAR